MSQVARVAIFRGHGEDFAARAEERPAAIRRDFVVGRRLADVLQPAAADCEIFLDIDGDFLRLFRGGIEPKQVSAVLEHDGVRAERWEFDVEIGKGSQFPGRLICQAIDIQVHPLVLVGQRQK